MLIIITSYLGIGFLTLLLTLLKPSYRQRPRDYDAARLALFWRPKRVVLLILACLFVPFVTLPMAAHGYGKYFLLYRRDQRGPLANNIKDGLRLILNLLEAPESIDARQEYDRIWIEIEDMRHLPVEQRRNRILNEAKVWPQGYYEEPYPEPATDDQPIVPWPQIEAD